MHWLTAAAVRAAIFMLLLAYGPVFAASPNVVVVLSNKSAPYVEFADALGASVARNGGTSRIVAPADLGEITSASTDVIVAVGLKAAEAAVAADARIPVINTLIPRAAFERVVARRADKSGFTAVFLDQPVARQLDLIRLALPDRKRIGAILGPDSEATLPALTAEASARGLKLHAIRIRDESELSSALQSVLSEVDVLLSLPDSVVFNQRTIQSVLFSAYRYQVPVIGFSPAYVRAGALIAVHSTPVHLAKQVTDILQRSGARPALPPPQYPDFFSIDVNEHVARSLEIKLDKQDVLEIKLRAPRPRL